MGEFTRYPDRIPFVTLGPRLGDAKAEEIDALDFLHLEPNYPKDTCNSCLLEDAPTKHIETALNVQNDVYVSGGYVPKNGMEHIVTSMIPPKARYIKSNKFLVWAGRTIYKKEKNHKIAHKPHLEETLEVCAVIKGRINYALSSKCHDFFNVVSVRKGQVALIMPGTYHTASPDASESGEHMCFKFLPLKDGVYQLADNDLEAPVEASCFALKSLNVDVDKYFENERSLRVIRISPEKKDDEPVHFDVPGSSRLHVKEVWYRHGDKDKLHADNYDLLALTITGSIIIRAADNSTIAVPKHQFVYVPAGVEHGWESPDGPALMMFVEVK